MICSITMVALRLICSWCYTNNNSNLDDDDVHVDDNDEEDIAIVFVGSCGIVLVVVGKKALPQRLLAYFDLCL